MRHAARLRLVLTAGILPALAAGSALADDIPASAYALLPVNFAGSSRTLPGERREERLSSERALVLSPSLQWLTSTDLSRSRLEQPYPVRAQSLILSTGPRIRLGNTELALPFDTGREASSLSREASWSGSAPRMTVALGPSDKVKLEARVSSRNDPQSSRRQRSASLSWRHSFNDHWSLTAGLRQERESDTLETAMTRTDETYASVEASLHGGWRWSLASSLANSNYGMGVGAGTARRNRSASLSLSTRYPLYDGWWISGELRTRQSWGEAETPQAYQSGGLKLFRNF